VSVTSSNGASVKGHASSGIVAGFLAAAAIFVALVGIVQHPVRIEPAAAVIALVAAGMAGPHQRRLAAWAIVFVGVSFFLGMTAAVLTNHALW
jgi:hypothetical protein